MNVPEAFLTFSGLLHQDVLVLYPSWQEAVRRTRDFLTTEQLESVRGFLDQLVSGDYGSEQLREVWLSSKSDFYVEGNMVEFFKVLRSCLD